MEDLVMHLVDTYRRFGGTPAFFFMSEGSVEIAGFLVNIYQNTRRKIPETIIYTQFSRQL
jgi:hypothetical protein